MSDVEQLRRMTADRGGRIYLGATRRGVVLGDPEQAVLVLGPPRSGKTISLAIPNVAAAPAAVVATSTKPDVMAATAGARRELGRCWLLDPTGTTDRPDGVTRIRWSPVASARTWDESLVVARSLAGAARPSGRLGESAHWTERAEALLAPLLHAAHQRGDGMDAVVRWVLGQDLEPARRTLVADGIDTGAAVLAGIAATDPREQSGIWSSTAGLLAAYRADAVLDGASAPNIDPAGLAGSGDTVYVCAPARQQELVAPIVVSFIDQVCAGGFARRAADPAAAPVTLVLDELANIAPLPTLPALVSEGGGQGVLTLACLQDLSQARQRWGRAADGFLSLFGGKLVLPGIGDLATLELISRLAGEIDTPARGVSGGPWWGPGRGAPTVSWSARRQRRLPVDAVSQQPPGSALVLAGARPPERVTLRPWWPLDPRPVRRLDRGRSGPGSGIRPGRSRGLGRPGPGEWPGPGTIRR